VTAGCARSGVECAPEGARLPLVRARDRQSLLSEAAIRSALVQRLSVNRAPGELLIEELGILQGDSRVDVAVINGAVHGYEIKSDADTLDRLAAQVEAYSLVLHFVTLVATSKHATRARRLIPRWWGVAVADDAEHGVRIVQRRKARPNPSLDPFSLAQLLWRDEVAEILQTIGITKGLKRKPRRAMWALLADALSVSELTARVCRTIRSRGDWRVSGSSL